MSSELPRLRITEIFFSLQGESSLVGYPTVFIRLTGCPLRCGYCDTAYAFTGGEWMTVQSILQQVKQYQTPYVCVTGGEPLAQKDCQVLLTELCANDYQVSLETSGALPVSAVDHRVKKIMDLKTPGSGEESRNLYENIDALTSGDEVKFVICHREDYEWAKSLLDQYELTAKCGVLFSPVQGELSPTELAEWILQDQLAVRFQIQLHKHLWSNQPGK
ncbi:MAG: 7-carboxy-7-deazaguanine synthase QueE [Gammaproteobacteria bacterium]|nr:7-carboxy-7-deazaguanine synthase QueE [Gammaproteobacteria bacterium]